jgi:hypothetical protein
MNEKKLIEKIGNLDKLYGEKFYVALDDVLDLVKQLDEPETGHADEAPRYVKNILARLRELPLHDREVWLKAIMGEFEKDFSHAKWREGYEQGKFEGVFGREKVKIPQFVAGWIEYCKFTHVDLQHALIVGDVDFYNYANQTDFSKLKEFLETENNQATFARAWLDGYEIEEEKRYLVKVKGVSGYGRYLNKALSSNEYFFASNNEIKSYRTKFTRKELEEAGFGWVFDCPGLEVEEVTE